jgi:CHAD domain-containing protein
VVAAHAAAYDPSVAESQLERERKLLGDHGMLACIGGEPLDTRVFTSTYFDTNDRRLLRRGVTLRRRVENGRSRWQLKLPQLSGRLEVEADGGPVPPVELYDLLTAFLGGRKLAPAATLRTRRRGVRVSNGNGAADVVADEVSILEGSRQVDTFDELEVELVSGDESLLDVLERRLHDAGARRGTGEIKLERVLGPPPRLVNDPPSRSAPPLEHLLFQLRTQYEAIVRHDPGVRLGTDPEDVHDLRVAVRRLRAMLRAARPMLAPEWSEPLRDELKWLGGELGPLRDADVFLAYLRGEADDFEASDREGLEQLEALVEDDRRAAHARALAALRSERYLSLLRELERTARAPRVRSARAELDAIAGTEFRKLRKAARKIRRSSTDEELHALRIRGKRARYAAELAATAVGKRARKFLKVAKRFQDVVGEHQDAVVAEEHLRALEARGGREAGFVAGRLVERQRARRRQARGELEGAWKRLERAGRRAWR